MLDIVEAVDGPIRGLAPFNGSAAKGQLNRKLGNVCKQMADQARKHLEKVHLADLAGKR